MPTAAFRPDAGECSLLADAVDDLRSLTVLPPRLQRLAAGVLGQGLVYGGGEVALKDACAAGLWP